MSQSGRASARSAELRPADLRAFHKKVRRVLLALVNDHGVQCRMPDGQHVLLYPPNGERPFKVSAHRPVNHTLTFIEEQFCKSNNLEMP
jgi:hypothetical protein